MRFVAILHQQSKVYYSHVGPEPIQMADHDLLFENRKVSVVGYVQVDLDDIDTTNTEKTIAVCKTNAS